MRKLSSYIITSFFLIAGAPPLEYVGNPLDNTAGGRRGLHWFGYGIDRDLAAFVRERNNYCVTIIV